MNATQELTCSLRRRMRIVPANLSAWKVLARFHYRSHHPGAVDKVFALEYHRPLTPSSAYILGANPLLQHHPELAGVIVYAMPMLNIAARNRVTGNRYTGRDRRRAAQLLNREVRCISRVVIHPRFRGIGLAVQLVRQTLPLAGVDFVEALAVMGRVNPFFEKAGLQRSELIPSRRRDRLLAELKQVGIARGNLYDPETLLQTIACLPRETQQFITGKILPFVRSFKNRPNITKAPLNWHPGYDMQQLLPYLEVLVEHLFSRPVYYFWRRNTP